MSRVCKEGWLRTYVAHQRHQESPKMFHFWTGVSTIAGALRRKVWTEHISYQYTPNFYIVLVAPPGVVAKSTSIRQGLSLLEKAVKDIRFGPQSATWQALIDAIHAAAAVVVDPETSEKLTMSCITIGISELGTFMRPENREYLDQLITLYDAQKESILKKTRGEEVKLINPWLNLIACTTPSWLKDNFPDILVGGGLASRILFVYEERKQQLIPYPELLVKGEQYENEEKALVHDLQKISKICGRYQLTPEAYEWGDAWYRGIHNGSRPAHLSGDRFAGYISRKQAHVHKLAIVLAASYRDDRTIQKSDLEEADAHVTLLEKNMYQVFDSIGVSTGAKINNEVIEMIKHTKGGALYKQLYQVFSKRIDGKAYKETIAIALEMGIIKRELVPGGDSRLTYVQRRE